MFQKLSDMLTQLESPKGSKAKGVLLKEFVKDADFLWMADMALSQGHSFGVKTFPEYDPMASSALMADAFIKSFLETMKENKGVTDSLLHRVHTLACQSEGHYKVITRILRKDLRCGCGADSINRALPGAVYKCPYQRCGDITKIRGVHYPAQLELKANGMFTYSHAEGYFTTRQGHQFSISDNPVSRMHNDISELNQMILIQELTVVVEGVTLPRAEGNGIINSFIKGEGEERYSGCIRAHAWGMITNEEFATGKGATPYKIMFPRLVELLGTGGAIQPIPNWPVNSLKEAQAKANELIAAGEEGGVLKDIQSDEFVWQDEDPCNFQFKMKAEAEAEFEIVDAYYGELGKKYEHLLGGIKVKTSDGLLLSDCGGGFPDSARKLGVPFWKDQIGKIVTLKFNGVTSKDGTTMKALDHPRIISEIRLDKTVADTLEYCQKELLGGI